MGDAEAGTSFGWRLRQHRVAAGLTQEALAERTGLGVRTIQGLESGESLPRRESIRRLAEVLQLTGEARAELERAAQPAPRQVAAPTVARDAPGDRTGQRTPRHNLPASLTSFVGRETEIAEIQARLRSARLLTLTGTGGCGKTRLALQVATDLLGSYPDGVWFAELAAVSDRQFVPFAIAGAVGVQAEPGQPIEDTLFAALRSRGLLLVLDNCEHLIDACARLAEALLRGCPTVQILATSREALGVAGEVVWRVPSLPVPPLGQLPPDLGDSGGLSRFAGVRLFVERAQLVAPGFRLSAANASAVAEICWRLDGIPLAIELAAARVKVLGPEQIAGRLDDRFRLLTGGSRTALPRQQTLKATIDWSYELLSETESRLLRRLAVFAGSWSLEAAEAVGAEEGIAVVEVLDLLSQLVDKSLVQVERQEGAERYRLLETLRQYGQDRLVEAGEAESARNRHRDWFLQLAERAEPELIGPRQVAWFDRLEAELDNFRVALAWCLESGAALLGLRLAGALWRLWFARDYYEEGRDWLARVLAVPGAQAPTAARAKALDGAVETALYTAGVLGAQPLAEESLAIYLALGDDRGIAWALKHLWHLAHIAQEARFAGDVAGAEALAAEALERARGAGDSWVVAQALESVASQAGERGNFRLARRHAEESVAIFRELGDRRGIAMGLIALCWIGGQTGDYAAARASVQEGLKIARELRSPVRIGQCLDELGILSRLEGDFGQSRAFLEESLSLARGIGDRGRMGVAVYFLGTLARAEGDVAGAEVLAKESLSHLHGTTDRVAAAAAIAFCGVLAIQRGAHRRGARLLGVAGPQAVRRFNHAPDYRRDFEDAVLAGQAALGEEVFATVYAEGQAMTLDEAVQYALAGGND